ncbi:hypothetical protein ABBQ38_012415 [Trebouxia sp. C0009 RCD-2024]
MQKVLAGISKGMSSEQLFERLCDIHFDQEVLQLLRAFTALEFLGHPAITALTLGKDLSAIVQEEILPQDKEAEELQIRALTRALSVRVRVLDVAGASAYARLYELRDAQDHPNSSASGSTVGVDGADPSAQVVHLLHTPGHYNLVYPAGQNILSPQDAISESGPTRPVPEEGLTPAVRSGLTPKPALLAKYGVGELRFTKRAAQEDAVRNGAARREKKCSGCDIVQATDAFYESKHGPGRLSRNCITCIGRQIAAGGCNQLDQSSKVCVACGELKALEEFFAQGHYNMCMRCDATGKKVCSMCGEDKEFAAFNLDVKDNRLLSTCKDCLCKKEMTECSRCGDVKQPSAFCAETVGNDGILPVCKACLSKQETKECSECGIVKLPSAFCARAAGSDGMGPVCKACLSKQGKKGCSMCGEIKESAAFYLDAKTNRLSSACKDCNRKRRREKARDAAAGKCCKRARCQDAEHAEPAQHSLYAEQAHGFPVQTQTTQVTPQQAQHGQHTLSAEPGQDKVVARQAPQESKKSSRGRPIKPKVRWVCHL